MSDKIDHALYAIVLLFLFSISCCVYASSAHASHGDFPVVRFLLSNGKSVSLPVLRLDKQGKAKAVTTCKAFIENVTDWRVREGANNMRVLADYQPCIARYIFRRGKASLKSQFHHDFSSLIVKSMDLSGFPSSLQKRVDRRHKTLTSLGLKAAVNSETSVLIKPKGWIYRFDLLAKGDFTHDGNEDLLVRFIDQAQNRKYLAVETLVLTKTRQRGLWQAINGIDFVRRAQKMMHGRH